MLFKNNKEGKLGENAAVIAGLGGGIISIAVYAGVPMSGILGAVTQVVGALGIIAVALLVYSQIAK